MSKVSDENLEVLISGLADYKKAGVIDPWVLSEGEGSARIIIEPLDILTELRDLRAANNPRKRPKPKKRQTDTPKPSNKPPFRSQQSQSKGLAD